MALRRRLAAILIVILSLAAPALGGQAEAPANLV